MDTDCHTASHSGSSEHQNLGAVNSFEGQKGGLSTLNREPNKQIRVVTCKNYFFSLYFVKYMVFIVWKALRNNLDHSKKGAVYEN